MNRLKTSGNQWELIRMTKSKSKFLQIKNTKQFKKDFKKYINKKDLIKEFDNLIKCLAKGESLAEHHRDHPLVGNWVNYRECHVKNDILLIYRIDEKDKKLFLERLGSHSELFK